MMPEGPSGAGFLKQKVLGGIPMWAVIGAVGMGGVAFIWYQNSRRSPNANSSQNALGTAAGTAGSAPPIYVSTLPSVPADGTTQNPGGQPGTPAGKRASVKPWAGTPDAWLYSGPGTGDVAATVPSGTQVSLTGPGVQGQPAGDPHHLTAWYPVDWGGQTLYLSAADIGGFGGMGGRVGRSSRLHAETPWQRFTQKAGVPSYWSSGMGGAGSGHVGHLARQLKTSPQRLLALNPHLQAQGGRIRPGQRVFMQ